MYAIVQVGSKQYRVKKNDIFETERLAKKDGTQLQLKKVLLINDGKKIMIGQPTIRNAIVTCEVLTHLRGEKTVAFKYRRRKASKKKIGHRQELTRLEVKKIEVE
jgi:large subunit ribosomal protein L21